MTLPQILQIDDGIIYTRGHVDLRKYLLQWQRENHILDGTDIILCPRDQAKKVEDFLESLRALQETRKNLTA